MIRILEMCNQLGLGGTEKVMQIFCKYLNREDYIVYSCGLFDSGKRENFFREVSNKLILPYGDINIVKNFILENNIDILHFHNINLIRNDDYDKVIQLFQFCKKRGIILIETSPFSVFDSKIDSLLDFKIFVSQINILKYFIKYKITSNNESKYHFLYNPLDIEDLSKKVLNKRAIEKRRIEYGINPDDFVIGKVGRSDLWKWDDAIIKIVPHLIKKIPHLKVVIRAIPKQRFKMIKPFSKYFIILPETSNERELAETYQMMDVLYHTSRIGECNSVAINEAMYFGLPVITNSTDFLALTLFDRDNGQIEIIKDGVNGYIENTLRGAAQKIIRLKEDKDLYNKISKQNKECAIELFSAEIITDKLSSIFKKTNFLSERISLKEYNQIKKKESFLDLLKINVQAILDKKNL